MNLPNDIPNCHKLILELVSQIETLTVKVGELEGRLNKDSTNSNKPPSSDGLQKKPAFPRKRNKNRGGQKSHKGKTLDLVATPNVDEIKPLLPEKCICGHTLDISKAVLVERRQVFDIPSPKLFITEYQKLHCNCGDCGLSAYGEFPSEVRARTQYGTGVRSLTVLLNCDFAMPVNKIQRLFTDLFGYKINESTITNNNILCHDQLEAAERKIQAHLCETTVGHSDETGVRVAGKLHWLHVFATTLYTFFFVHAKRGKKALEDQMSILPDFSGWLVHDCWRSYFKFKGCKHAICGAHILRELTALTEQHIKWAVWFKRYLLTLHHLAKENGGVLSEQQQKKALILYQKICSSANEIEPLAEKKQGKPGRPKSTKGRNLLNRLINHQEAVLAFAFFEEVPFTNNLAERDLRPAKTKQKVSGCFRTMDGAQRHARISSFISTVRKHQLNIFNELKDAINGNSAFIDSLGY